MAFPPVEYHRLRHGRHALTLELWPNRGAGMLLFYPGSMFSPIQYRALLLALHESGLAVAALHLTGHGCNPHWVGFRFEDLLADGLQAEAWLLRQGYGPLAVCGHSQGGILTLAHAAARPIRAAFPITGILPQQEEAGELTIFRRCKDRQLLQERIAGLARYLPLLPLPIPAYLSIRRICANARSVSASRRQERMTYPLGFLASLFTTRIEPQMRCPVYLFNALDDALFTPALAQSTFALLQAPLKKLIWLPGGGHLAALNPQLCRFMARHIAAVCAGMGLALRLPAKG